MAGKRTPTEAEIMRYRNVPVAVAAAYIGWSAQSIRYALREGRISIGSAVEREKNWSFHIIPAALIKYQNGELPPAFTIKEIKMIVGMAVNEVVDAKLGNLNQVLQRVTAA